MNAMKLFALLLIATIASATSYVAPESNCWTETRKCRWEPKHEGYKCKDYYGEKYSRCHPVYKYKSHCDKPTYMPVEKPAQPEDTVNWDMGKCETVHYTKDYTTPTTGYSDYYDMKKLPKHPKDYPDVKPTPSSSPAAVYTEAPVYVTTPRGTKPTTPVYTNPNPPHTSPKKPDNKYTAPAPAAPAYVPASEPVHKPVADDKPMSTSY